MDQKGNEEKTTIVSLQIPLWLKKKIDVARGEGKSFSFFARGALTLYADISLYLSDEIEEIADRFDLEESQVIKNIIVRYFAEQEAYKEVFKDIQRLPVEFNKTMEGVTLNVEALSKRLKQEFIATFEELKTHRRKPEDDQEIEDENNDK